MDFRKKAKEHVEGSHVLANREKVPTENLIGLYPDGVTITDFDFLNGTNGKYVVCDFAEDTGRYFNGGKILTSIFESFVEDYEGDYKTCLTDFKAAGGIHVKFTYDRTKAGNRIVKVDVI